VRVVTGVRLAASLLLAGFAAAAAAGAPTPAEAILAASGAGAGGIPVALAVGAAWVGYSVGDAASFTLLRGGVYRRLPERWRRRIEATPVRRIGVRTVFASRLLPGSAAVNVLAAASEIPTRRFLAAAVLGELAFAAAIVGVGAGGAALLEASLPALAAAVAAGAVMLVRARRRAGGTGAAPATRPAR
jgi:membrane protein DedA with SNARE-associated domain